MHRISTRRWLFPCLLDSCLVIWVRNRDLMLAFWSCCCCRRFCFLSVTYSLSYLLCSKVEDLFLLFAKKASAFNSWFENAEEDLTDPVRCNSVEEIRVSFSSPCKQTFLTKSFFLCVKAPLKLDVIIIRPMPLSYRSLTAWTNQFVVVRDVLFLSNQPQRLWAQVNW